MLNILHPLSNKYRTWISNSTNYAGIASRILFIVIVGWYILTFLRVFNNPYLPIASDEIGYFNEIRLFSEKMFLGSIFFSPEGINAMSTHGIAHVLTFGFFGKIFGFTPHTQIIVNVIFFIAALLIIKQSKINVRYWYLPILCFLLNFYTSFYLFSYMMETVHIFFAVSITTLLFYCYRSHGRPLHVRYFFIFLTVATILIAALFRPTWALFGFPLLFFSRNKFEFSFFSLLQSGLLLYGYYVWKTFFAVVPFLMRPLPSSGSIYLAQGNFLAVITDIISNFTHILAAFFSNRYLEYSLLLWMDIFILFSTFLVILWGIVIRNRFLVAMSSTCFLYLGVLISLYTDTQHRLISIVFYILTLSFCYAKKKVPLYVALIATLVFLPYVASRTRVLIASHRSMGNVAQKDKSDTQQFIQKILETVSNNQHSGEVTVLVNNHVFYDAVLATALPLWSENNAPIRYQIWEIINDNKPQFALFTSSFVSDEILARYQRIATYRDKQFFQKK